MAGSGTGGDGGGVKRGGVSGFVERCAPGPLFLSLAVLFHLDKILLGPYAQVPISESIDTLFTHHRAMGQLFLEHGLFGWYPFQNGGIPSFAWASAYWDLPSLLAAVLPMWLLCLVWFVLQTWLTGYGMCRMLRDFFQVEERYAVLGGVLAAVFFPMVINLTFVYAFPLFFVWTNELAEPGAKYGLGGRILRVLGLLALSLSSYAVLTLPLFSVLHVVLLVFFGAGSPNLGRRIAAAFLVWFGYCFLYAPVIAELFLYIPFAQRGYDTHFFGYASAAREFWGYFSNIMGRGNSWIGVVLLFAPFALRLRRLRLLLALIVFAYAVSAALHHGSQLRALFEGSLFLKVDYMSAWMWAAVLTPVYLALSLREMAVRRYWPPVWVVGFAVACVVLFKGSEQVILLKLLLMGLSLAALGVLRGQGGAGPGWARRFGPVLFLVCFVWAFLLLRQNYLHTHGSPAVMFRELPAVQSIADEARRDPLRVACADMNPFLAQAAGLDTFGWQGPLFSKYYKAYATQVSRPQFEKLGNLEYYKQQWHYIKFTFPDEEKDEFALYTLNQTRRRTLEDFNLPMLLAMNVRYIFSAYPMPALGEAAELVYSTPGEMLPLSALRGTRLGAEYTVPLSIYKLRGGFERGYVASAAVPVEDDAQALELMSGSAAETLRRTVFLSRADVARETPERAAAPAVSGSVRLTRQTPDELVFEGRTEGPAHLVVTNNFHPGWRATVNGEQAPVLRANVAFQAVPLPGAGNFRVVLRFYAPEVPYLHLVSLAGVGLFFACLLLGRGVAGGGPLGPCAPVGQEACSPAQAAASVGGPSARRLVLFGAGVIVLWGLGFFFFVLQKDHGRTARPLAYMLSTLPVLGLLLSVWCTGLLRRLTARTGRDA